MRWPRGLGGVAGRGRAQGPQHTAAQPAQPLPAGDLPAGVLAFANRSFGVSKGAEEGREGKGQCYSALARSKGDEVKLARLGPARRAPGAWGGVKPSGGTGRPGPHLLNRARAQAAPGPKRLAEQFVVQPRGRYLLVAGTVRKGTRGRRNAQAGGRAGRASPGRNTKRRARLLAGQVWKVS